MNGLVVLVIHWPDIFIMTVITMVIYGWIWLERNK